MSGLCAAALHCINPKAMNLVDLVALVALLQLLVLGFLVGSARGRYGAKARAGLL
ncbi:MAG: hypothetical protein H6R06_3564 [Proteobacteria bacterium]|jgi:hypothetical protein|nr:hypothetical protein [Pseudomonadota bacterium]